jgi:hypothetical protein
VLKAAEDAIKDEIESIGTLATTTSNTPYYKYVIFPKSRGSTDTV